MSIEHGVLYVVATPIGNLSDISPRGLETLTEVDEILAEDTRHSRRLLKTFGIDTRMTSFHAHNEQRRSSKVIQRMVEGESLALISDAGTPLVSDPGCHLVKHALANGIKVIPVPGACALACALSISGINANQFVFEGFLPAASGARRSRLQTLTNESSTLVFYEAPHRIEALLGDLVEIFGSSRTATVARELTKSFETIITGSLSSLVEKLAADEHQRKGEFVVVVEGSSELVSDDDETQRVLRLLLEDLSLKQAVLIAVKLTGEKKNKLYRLATGILGDASA